MFVWARSRLDYGPQGTGAWWLFDAVHVSPFQQRTKYCSMKITEDIRKMAEQNELVTIQSAKA